MPGTDFPDEGGMVMAVWLVHSRRLLFICEDPSLRQFGMGEKMVPGIAANDKASSENRVQMSVSDREYFQ